MKYTFVYRKYLSSAIIVVLQSTNMTDQASCLCITAQKKKHWIDGSSRLGENTEQSNPEINMHKMSIAKI